MARLPRWVQLLLLVGGLILLGPASGSSPPSRPRPVFPAAERPTAPLVFEPNAGQTAAPVRFLVHSAGGTLFFTPDGVVFTLPAPTPPPPTSTRPLLAAPAPPRVVQLRFLAAAPTLEPGPTLPGQVNYLLGADPHAWHT